MRPRVLRDVTDVRLTTSALGCDLRHPIGIAPTAFHKIAHPDGEVATARGAAESGSLYVMSTRSTSTPEAVGEAMGDSPWWFQVYVLKDRDFTASLVKRAVAARTRALVLTGDTPVVGRRVRDLVNRFVIPSDLGTIESLERPAAGGGDQHTGVTFDDIGTLAEHGLPVVVKGVLRADDAVACVDAGASAVWVSNHGGRQLDGAISTAVALPEVVDAVGDRADVYVDGGIRRGTDVLKALALGADLCFLGRPILWGLADAGAAGVTGVLDGFATELELGLALAGATSLAEVTPDLLWRGKEPTPTVVQ